MEQNYTREAVIYNNGLHEASLNESEAHWRNMIEITAAKEYGDRKTARRVELLPEFHLMTEINEMLHRKAFPYFQYSPFSGHDLIEIPSLDDYDKVESIEYHRQRMGDINDVSLMFKFLIDGFLKALILVVDDYPVAEDGSANSIKDLLMRDFVDQIHRQTRSNVEAGAQFNIIEDPYLVGEEYSTNEAVAFLDRCYRRLEDIQNGLSEYISFQGEDYIPPAAYPELNSSSVTRFMQKYINSTHNNLAKYFNTFHPEATYSTDYMLNYMLEFKTANEKIKTPWGAGVHTNRYAIDRLKYADTHVKQVTDRMNEIGKQAQILVALTNCITTAWNKLPNCRTLTCWVIFQEVVNGYMEYNLADMRLPPMFDQMKIIRNPDFLDEIFYGDSNAIDKLNGVIDAYNYVREVMELLSDEYDNGNETPMWNFKRDTWRGGQIEYTEAQTVVNGDPNKGFRLSMEQFRESTSDAVKANNINIRKEIESIREKEGVK